MGRPWAARTGRRPGVALAGRAIQSLDALDFAVLGPAERLAQVELKAKHQPYRGWGHLRPELAEADPSSSTSWRCARSSKPAATPTWSWPTSRRLAGVRSTVELVLASKVRTVRTLVTGTTRLKAKALLDLREAAVITATATEAVASIASCLDHCDRQWSAIGPWPTGPAVRDPARRTS